MDDGTKDKANDQEKKKDEPILSTIYGLTNNDDYKAPIFYLVNDMTVCSIMTAI